MKTAEAKKRVDEVARRHADAQVALTNARHALEQAQADLDAARAAEALERLTAAGLVHREGKGGRGAVSYQLHPLQERKCNESVTVTPVTPVTVSF